MPTVWVRFADHRKYPIVIQPGVISSIGPLTRQYVRGKSACLISHPGIFRRYGKAVEKSLQKEKITVQHVLVPEGETTKSMARAEAVIGKMIQMRIERSGFIVALGGGVVGDLAGFVAATYMRGIEFIQVPTTLLAQVDSSVGGKVAVNHAKGKNLIGAFLQPRLVVTDPEVLKTLPSRQLRSGLAEIIKAAIIADRKFFCYLQRVMPKLLTLDMHVLSTVIAKSCAIKGAVVEQDEKEQGLRALLNYGHTFGHALEAYTNFVGYTHGEAVALGMVLAVHLARNLGLCTPETQALQVALIRQAGLPIQGKGENAKKIWQLMKTDKKVSEGENNFVLTPHIGHARIVKKIPCFSVCQTLETVLGNA